VVAIAYDSVVGGPSRNITYDELRTEVENFAAALRTECGVVKGLGRVFFCVVCPFSSYIKK
jgi:acyl-coenzyme A synthetase/AMP-(fatty) acid ligase